jgi:DNA-binding MarR family transcriptional regulator
VPPGPARPSIRILLAVLTPRHAIDAKLFLRYTLFMQSLDNETISNSNPSSCAAQLIEVTPVIMRSIRSEMRRRTMPDLSVPQFRTLSYLQKNPRTSLSDLSEHLGLTLPSTSKLIQNLVKQKVVARRHAADRRRVCLVLTSEGLAAFDRARTETRQKMAEKLNSLTNEQLATVSSAMKILHTAFSEGSTIVSLP